MTTILLLGAWFLLNLFLPTLLLWVGARRLKASRATFPRALSGIVLLWMMGLITLVLNDQWQRLAEPNDDPLRALVFPIGLLLIELFLASLFFKWILKTSFGRAALLWFMTVVLSAGAVAIAIVVIRPYIMEAFVPQSNSMAPTVLGWHKTATCPLCGRTMFVPVPAPQEMIPEHDHLGICGHCLRTSEPAAVSRDFYSPDRIIANKLMTPRRWDLIVFRYPENPSIKYVKRLVGLPGEEVFIKDGAIWVNGTRLTPPQAIANLQYTAEIEGAMPVQFGSPDQPWHLGTTEFCVLGDFSVRASDSRFWGAVPGANIGGVVTLTYWPVERWRIWR
jgi:signal peptidase I